MNLLETGKRVMDARLKKGMTQEELAEMCDINVRTIQRIEKGKVRARGGTLKSIKAALEMEEYEGEDFTKTLWVILLHLSNLMPVILIPLLIFSLKSEEIPEVRGQWKDVVNFQITMCILLFSSALMVFVGIGLIFLLILGPFISFITLLNIFKIINSGNYHYPSFKFVK